MRLPAKSALERHNNNDESYMRRFHFRPLASFDAIVLHVSLWSNISITIGVVQTRPKLDEPGRRLTEGKRERRTFHGQGPPEAIKWCGNSRAEQRVWNDHVDTLAPDHQSLFNRERISAPSGITTSLGAAKASLPSQPRPQRQAPSFRAPIERLAVDALASDGRRGRTLACNWPAPEQNQRPKRHPTATGGRCAQ